MKKQKLTPWFPEHIKPIYPGFYKTQIYMFVQGYSYWNGAEWGYQYTSIEIASKNKKKISEIQNKEWRGLDNKPKGIK